MDNEFLIDITVDNMFTVLCIYRYIICLFVMKIDNESKRTKTDNMKKDNAIAVR